MSFLKLNYTLLNTIKRYSSVSTDSKYKFYNVYECKKVNNVNQFYFQNPNENYIKGLSRKYNLFSMYSFVVQFDEFIDTMDLFPDYLARNVESFLSILACSDVMEVNHDYLAVVEHAPIKGFHINYIIITPQPLNSNQIKLFADTFDIKVTYEDEDQNLHEVIPLIKHEQIKSPGSWLNYLKKNPLCIVSNKIEILTMFSSFDKVHIFHPDSMSKRFKRDSQGNEIVSKDAMVQFFFQCFDQNKIDINDIYKLTDCQRFIHFTNFKQIYMTSYNTYLARRTLTDELMSILTSFMELHKDSKCFCPVNDWLDFQDIHNELFYECMEKWLFGTTKQNVLYFIGPANTGKSHIARLIWSCFLSHKIILPDGIYSFANLVNAGAGLWEEPLVTPDQVDMVKLIFEGEPSAEVSIKHQPSAKLGKRIPMIVTTNKELSTYCSNEHQFLEARLFRFSCRHNVTMEKFCKGNNGEHYCPLIEDHYDFIPITVESCRSFNNEATNNESEEDTRRRDDTRKEELPHAPINSDCFGIHHVKKNHIITFLAFIIIRKLDQLYAFNGGDISNVVFKHVDILKLADFVHRHSEKLTFTDNFCVNSLNPPDI